MGVAEGPQLLIQRRSDEDGLDERRGHEDRIAARGRDGTLRKGVTIWGVRHDDRLYVRSVNGRTAAWFRGALATYEGRIRAGGVEKDVTFVDPNKDIGDTLDTAYRSKYRRYAKASWVTSSAPRPDQPPWNSSHSRRASTHQPTRPCRRLGWRANSPMTSASSIMPFPGAKPWPYPLRRAR